MKKEYIKPDMMVVKLQMQESVLLPGSGKGLIKGFNNNLIGDDVIDYFGVNTEVGRAAEYNMNIITWDEW